ncbi:LytR/AlgR family response regulator transcription factor [Pedobacter zeae]|uniref:DNA-binding LytR/AlgR family response regulator n=1 Tax=Pedobacter zeae TaxID=1737356 RepID=A0A7W6K7T3_9SPHI|nr:LytTR family DNA-binding domain-containing protein [Pedobacter zeae]MBB4106705.1 DNA-binding LytR/AlgR family response regulator [Pedobacter zeae]GGH03255.1 DNA-binding response regulator [Pedobacter zeae]
MINCIIVDDEAHAIDVLRHYIRSIRQLNLIASFTRPTEAITFLNGQQVDLIFLDIHMPEISGIDFIQTIRHENYHFILTTAYREFALDGFDLGVIDYLIKPIPLTRFLQAVTKAQKIINLQNADRIKNSIDNDYFMVKAQTKGKIIKIKLSDIDYIEGMKNYIAFHHNGNRTLALSTMKDIEGKLPEEHFIRVQKSFIIALNKITALDGNRVMLQDVSSEILIGETYRQHFLETIKKKQIL